MSTSTSSVAWEFVIYSEKRPVKDPRAVALRFKQNFQEEDGKEHLWECYTYYGEKMPTSDHYIRKAYYQAFDITPAPQKYDFMTWIYQYKSE